MQIGGCQVAFRIVLGGVPGIPFLAGGFVVAHWRGIRPGRDEIIKTSVFIAVMLALFAVLAVLR
jgi:hypothetical protein